MKTKLTYLTLFIALLFVSCKEDLSPNLTDDKNLDTLSNEANTPSISVFSDTDASGENYAAFEENDFVLVAEEPISTFSIDADGGAYSNTRRFLNDGQLPPKDAIRTEELINYFPLEYTDPTDQHPVAVNGEVSQCPWAPGHKLVRIGLKGKSIPEANYPHSNYVLLIDVSGSMNSGNKLPLLIESFHLLVDELTEKDRISIVTYAGSSDLVLPSTSCDQKGIIKSALNSLISGGGTNGAQGIITAYEIAEQHFIPEGNNRILIATDGDFNIGPSSQEDLVDLIEEKREAGVFLTVLGVGKGNLNDANLEQIANNGNGTYEYIDDLEQAKKVFFYEFGKFFTVAKDVKVQVEFNPTLIESYRLIGYENRLLNTEDFEDDSKDAGEIGAGQNITALYEVVPVPNTDFRFSPTFTIDFRYKLPDSDLSLPLSHDIVDTGNTFDGASRDMQLVASVASFGMWLRDSPHQGNTSPEQLLEWVQATLGFDPHDHRRELLELIDRAADLK